MLSASWPGASGPCRGRATTRLSGPACRASSSSATWSSWPRPGPARGGVMTGAWLEQLAARSTSERWRVAADLNWRRLKYWRRIVSQALAPSTAPGALESITEVRLEHGPHAVVQAWELLSWLA